MKKSLITGAGTLVGTQIMNAANIDVFTRTTINGLCVIVLFVLALKGKISWYLVFSMFDVISIDGFLSTITGAKVRKNKYTGDYYVIKENDLNNATKVEAGKTPGFGIEGIVTPYYANKGVVYKAENGTLIRIEADGQIKTIGGLGKILNKNAGGERDYNFCKQEDTNQNYSWLKLYEAGQTLK